MRSTQADELLSSPGGLQLLELISQRQAAAAADEDLNGLLEQLDFHVTRFRSDYEDHVAALKSKAAGSEALASGFRGA